MRVWGWFFRTLRAVVVTLVVLLLVAFAFVQIEQRVLRHRAERLLADFHSIRLNQSDWADAQRLMSRWGAWGHYDGTCNSTDCDYQVFLADPLSQDPNERPGWSWTSKLFAVLYGLPGARPSELWVRFAVQDKKIAQTSIVYMTYYKESYFLSLRDGFELIVSAHSSSSLAGSYGTMGIHESISEHPDYIVGRPGGCTFCEMGKITYTPFLSPTELARITSFNLSCMTRLHQCTELEELLPAASAWHLYSEAHQPDPIHRGCDISPRALGRDANVVLEVEAVSPEVARDIPADSIYDKRTAMRTSQVRLLRVIKGPDSWSMDRQITVVPFNAEDGDPHVSEHLEAGHRYLLLTDQVAAGAATVTTDWCGVLESRPDVLSQIEEGVREDLPLRRDVYRNNFF